MTMLFVKTYINYNNVEDVLIENLVRLALLLNGGPSSSQFQFLVQKQVCEF